MKTILVPTDFSSYATNALKVAASIAKKIKAEIKLVHVYNFPSSGYSESKFYSDFYRQMKTKAEQKLDELLTSPFLDGVKISRHFVTKMLTWELVTDTRFQLVDLIVIGSHGVSGQSKLFIGSNTAKIVQLAKAPVLTIKNEIEDFKVDKMVFASDFLKESYTVFEKIKFFADLYGSQLFLLKVITPKEFESTKISETLISQFVEKFDLTNYVVNIYNSLTIESGIIEFGDQVGADLIALQTHGRLGIAHLINRSLAEDIARHEARPVLSIKIPGNEEKSEK